MIISNIIISNIIMSIGREPIDNLKKNLFHIYNMIEKSKKKTIYITNVFEEILNFNIQSTEYITLLDSIIQEHLVKNKTPSIYLINSKYYIDLGWKNIENIKSKFFTNYESDVNEIKFVSKIYEIYNLIHISINTSYTYLQIALSK